MSGRNHETSDSPGVDSVLDSASTSLTLQRTFFASAVIAAFTTIVDSSNAHPRTLFLGGGVTLAFLLFGLLARLGQRTLAAVCGTLFLQGLACTYFVLQEPSHALVLTGLGFTLLLANLVLPRRFAKVSTGLTWLLVSGLLVAQYFRLLASNQSTSLSGSHAILLICVFSALVMIVLQLTDAYHLGNARARLQELSYQHIFNATTEAIFLVDPATERIVDVNESAQNMLGYSRVELLRSSLQQLANKHQARKQVVDMMEAGSKGQPLLFEWAITSKDGSDRLVEVSLRPTRVGTKQVLLAVMRDATETRRIQAKLQESEKLQAVGQLAGGIAHDFNNQLTGILANASLLQEKVQDERLRKAADVIVRCSRRSADLTAQLLAFARRGKHQNVKVNIHDLVYEVVDLLKHTIDKRISLKTELLDIDLLVRGDPTLLQNALLNLGLNARDAMLKGGTLTFSTGLETIEATQTGIAQSVRPGEYARVTVTDTGVGMDPATLKRAFEPFFTTKESGNGMGLAAVYGAVESHKGDITVQSSPGKGTTFTLLLPVADDFVDSVPVRLPRVKEDLRGLRVLFAEDERDVARATTALLQEIGCVVTHQEDGLKAANAFQERPDDFDVVLLDHMMPGISGGEALKQMRLIRPNVRAILTSGYSPETVIDDDNAGAQIFLPKPFSLKQLESSLGRALKLPEDRRATSRETPQGKSDASRATNELPSTTASSKGSDEPALRRDEPASSK